MANGQLRGLSPFMVSAFSFQHFSFCQSVAFGGFARGCHARLLSGVVSRKSGHSWQDSLFVRKNPPGCASFHPQSSIRYRLWLRRSRQVPVPAESRFFVRSQADRCKPFSSNLLEQDQVP
jgi:hypothetical protein